MPSFTWQDEAQAAVESFMETLLPAYEAWGAQKMGLKGYNQDVVYGQSFDCAVFCLTG